MFTSRLVQDDDPTLSGISGTTPPDLRSLLVHSHVKTRARLKHNGVVFARSSTHFGNSLILFYPNGDTTVAVAGSIKYIIDHDGRFTFAIHRYMPIPHNLLDPFRFYPHFPAKLYSAALSQDLELVELHWVLSHCARWQLSPHSAVILNLSRVCRESCVIVGCASLIHANRTNFGTSALSGRRAGDERPDNDQTRGRIIHIARYNTVIIPLMSVTSGR